MSKILGEDVSIPPLFEGESEVEVRLGGGVRSFYE